MHSEAMRHKVGVCGICGEGIYLELRWVPATSDLPAQIRAANDAHLSVHSATEIARFHLRSALELLPPRQRPRAVKRVYADLLRLWGDQETHGVYSIEEVLGSAALYRLWHEADGCGFHGCRHAPS